MRRVITAVALIVACAEPAAGESVMPWLSGLDFPTNMAFAPDGRLFFTEKNTGQVRVVSADGSLQPEPFATLDVSTQGEAGLLGIALHPRFADGEPWMYLYLSGADSMNRIVRLDAGGPAGDHPEVLLDTVPATNAYHNGGDLLFGADGMLYATVGEAHEPGRAQDPSDLGGKVLRLTPDGEAAPGNPFGAENPVFTLGHRNSFGLCLEPGTETIWETENGPDRDDEVNRLQPGANHGWPTVTGADGDGRYVDPVAVFPRPVALTGCAWWDGDLFVGSYIDGAIRRIDPVTGERFQVGAFGDGVTDLQVGPDGALYVATSSAIWRLRPGEAPPTMPAPADGRDRGWIAIAAAVVIAAALVVRWRAGRRAVAT